MCLAFAGTLALARKFNTTLAPLALTHATSAYYIVHSGDLGTVNDWQEIVLIRN